MFMAIYFTTVDYTTTTGVEHTTKITHTRYTACMRCKTTQMLKIFTITNLYRTMVITQPYLHSHGLITFTIIIIIIRILIVICCVHYRNDSMRYIIYRNTALCLCIIVNKITKHMCIGVCRVLPTIIISFLRHL